MNLPNNTHLSFSNLIRSPFASSIIILIGIFLFLLSLFRLFHWANNQVIFVSGLGLTLLLLGWNLSCNPKIWSLSTLGFFISLGSILSYLFVVHQVKAISLPSPLLQGSPSCYPIPCPSNILQTYPRRSQARYPSCRWRYGDSDNPRRQTRIVS